MLVKFDRGTLFEVLSCFTTEYLERYVRAGVFVRVILHQYFCWGTHLEESGKIITHIYS